MVEKVEIEVSIDSEQPLSDTFLYELSEDDIQKIFDQLTDSEIIKFIRNRKLKQTKGGEPNE